MTTELLGFSSMNFNVVYAQMGRGKMEKTVAFALSSIAATISKFAFDVCLFMSQNFGFVSLPEELTTGSSIMPHKKNPDVFELVRSHCNKIQAIPYQINLMTNNLPSGYFRDLQILKEVFLPAFGELNDCISIAGFAIDQMTVKTDLLTDEKYRYVFSVEDVNKLVTQGVPFRDAYKQVGGQINDGKYKPTMEIRHTHEGSIGNLCLDQISKRMEQIIQTFDFQQVEKAYGKLLGQ
jgi:argininosuccinate lyase